MAHVYATLAEFKQYLSGGDVGSDRDATLLTLLESASRTVDAFCDRGSGFGPVIETRTYIPSARLLSLAADVVHVGSLSVNEVLVAEGLYTFDGRVVFGSWPSGSVASVTGTFGYAGTTTTPSTALGAALTDEASDITVDDSSGLSVGQVVVIDDEQMRVVAIDDSAVTVVRGYNGTTAAAHDDEALVSVYVYPAEVVDATIRVAQRRWKMRDAGLTGDFGGVGIPATSHQDTENSILRATVGHLRFLAVA